MSKSNSLKFNFQLVCLQYLLTDPPTFLKSTKILVQLFNSNILYVGLPANETFRKKMQKFSFVFRKLFRVISHVFAKMNEAKNAKKANFANIFVEYATCFLKKKI